MNGARVSRRAWLAGSFLAAWSAAARGEEPASRGDDDREARLVRRKGQAAGLGAFGTAETRHFLGIGDGPEPYRRAALDICEQLAETFLKHFRDKGFAVALPARRLTVVTLKDRASYEKFLGEATGADVGGHYDVEGNRLVIFDFRPNDGEKVANAERVNLFTLIHEGIHQLTYNAGMLDPKGDVPLAISEGLATYGETWRPKRNAVFGMDNQFRREEIAKSDEPIPVATLLGDDRAFDDESREQLAYAQSWLLVHYLMRTPARLRQFRGYLGRIKGRRDGSSRIDDAVASFGPLDRLDRDLRKHEARVLRRR